jgi:hypothetical protein
MHDVSGGVICTYSEALGLQITEEKNIFLEEYKMHSRCFGIMGRHGNFAFNLIVKLSVELGYVFLSLRL